MSPIRSPTMAGPTITRRHPRDSARAAHLPARRAAGIMRSTAARRARMCQNDDRSRRTVDETAAEHARRR
jgi:hypothetical protein